MKFIFSIFLIAALIDPGKISQINTLKSEAKKAYTSGDYETAAQKYTYLVDSLGVKEDEVMMNMANAYFHLNDTTHTFGTYQALAQSANTKFKSVANQQLGVIENRQGNFAGALHYFKQALKADPTNEDARFNYELVKKKIEEKKNEEKKEDQKQDQENKEDEKKDQKQEKQKDPKDQDSKDQKGNKNEEDKNQEKKDSNENGEKKDDQEQKSKKDDQKSDKEVPSSLSDKLEQMNMSQEKANMILEALKNQEIQYLQQNKRKATQSKDNSKPDW